MPSVFILVRIGTILFFHISCFTYTRTQVDICVSGTYNFTTLIEQLMQNSVQNRYSQP